MFGLGRLTIGGDERIRLAETGTACGGQTTRPAEEDAGLIEGTMIATAMGWRPVEAIAEGDRVLTFDRGMQPVRAVVRARGRATGTDAPLHRWPYRVPAGAIGNFTPLVLLPEQRLLLESDTADLLFGDPFSLVRARDLDGLRGIRQATPVAGQAVVQLIFDDDEVVFANSGALLYCPSLGVINMADLMAARPDGAPYLPLAAHEVAMLVTLLAEDEDLADPPTPQKTCRAA